MCKLIALICLLLLSGCWDAMELNDISLVTGIGLDQGKNKRYRVSIEALNATEYSKGQSSQAGSSNSVVVSVEGDNIQEVLEQLHTKMARHLVFSHMQMVIVNEKVARAGFNDILDWLDRSRQTRNKLSFVVVKDATAAKLLQTTYPIQKVSTLKLKKQLYAASQYWALSMDVQIRDFLRSMSQKESDTVLPAITLTGSRKGGESLTRTAPEPIATISNLGVFKDYKLKGFLPLADVKNVMWVRGKIKRVEIRVFCEKGEKKDSFAVKLYDVHTKIRAFYKENIPYFHVAIAQEGRIDNSECSQSLMSNDTYKKMNEQVSQMVRNEIMRTIQDVQKAYKTDIFGFGEEMYRQEYKQFKKIKKWDEEFARARVRVSVETNLVRSGMRTDSFIHFKK